MNYTPETFFLILSLISKSQQSTKDKKKTLIKLAKKSSGSQLATLNDVLRDNNLVANITTVCDAQIEFYRLVNVMRDGGAQGVIIVGDAIFPIFVNIASTEDKLYSYTQELQIIASASTQIGIGQPPAVGTLCTGMMFKEDGFTGIAIKHRIAK